MSTSSGPFTACRLADSSSSSGRTTESSNAAAASGSAVDLAETEEDHKGEIKLDSEDNKSIRSSASSPLSDPHPEVGVADVDEGSISDLTSLSGSAEGDADADADADADVDADIGADADIGVGSADDIDIGIVFAPPFSPCSPYTDRRCSGGGRGTAQRGSASPSLSLSLVLELGLWCPDGVGSGCAERGQRRNWRGLGGAEVTALFGF